MLAGDARRERALASARTADHDVFVERDHGGVAERERRKVELGERLHQPEAGRLVVAEHVALHHAAVIEMQPDRLGLGDQIADGQHQPALVDQHAVAGALGAEGLGGEGVVRNDRVQSHHRRERLVEIVVVVLGSRLHRGRHFEIGQGRHGSSVTDRVRQHIWHLPCSAGRGQICRAGHSALAPEEATIGPHFSASDLMKAANESGPDSAGSEPSAISRSRISGNFITAPISRPSVCTMSPGVCAGATMPYQRNASKPGMPDSATVGISGASDERLAVDTARPFSVPARTCGRPVIIESIISGTLPATRSFSAGAEPRYGTCTMSMPAAFLIISIIRCGATPVPWLANEIAPGFALAAAITSATEFTPSLGCASSSAGATFSSASGANSRNS